MAKKVDVFPNRAFVSITMSGPNVLTFTPIRFGVGVFQGVALVLHKLAYFPSRDSLSELQANTDRIMMALTNRDDLVAIEASQQNVLANKQAIGVGAALDVIMMPIEDDFSNLPGGGLIIPANPLFLAMHSEGAVAALSMDFVMYYTFRELSDSDYIELIQSLIPVNI